MEALFSSIGSHNPKKRFNLHFPAFLLQQWTSSEGNKKSFQLIIKSFSLPNEIQIFPRHIAFQYASVFPICRLRFKRKSGRQSKGVGVEKVFRNFIWLLKIIFNASGTPKMNIKPKSFHQQIHILLNTFYWTIFSNKLDLK